MSIRKKEAARQKDRAVARRYIVKVWGYGEPTVGGPYKHEDGRIRAARKFFNESNPEETGTMATVLRLDIDKKGRPRVGVFYNYEMQ